MSYSEALVALSGGGDSALALHLTAEAGLRVRAACVDMGEGVPEEARAVAELAGVQLLEVDGSDRFRRQVADPIRRMLSAGLTPNPCALCNPGPKLGLLNSLLNPQEVLVTGHYAFAGPEGLRRGLDRNKDQSYFLSLVPPGVLRNCMMPLGAWTKRAARAKVAELGLPSRQRESMDLCFDPSSGIERPSWTVVDRTGSTLCEDLGPLLPTIGQRLRLPGRAARLYVYRMDPAGGILHAGPRELLEARGCLLSGVNDLGMPDAPTFRGTVQIRYRKDPEPCLVSRRARGLLVRFDRQLESVAPGQVGAVAIGSRLVAGGTIERALKGGDLEH